MEANDPVMTHVWQEKGLGTAPFRAVAVISFPSKSLLEANPSAYYAAAAECSQSARHFGVTLGMCDVCGMSLQNNFIIRDATGRHFVVGCDCAGKTGDVKLVTRGEYLEKRRLRDVRAARRAAEQTQRDARRAAELKDQRDRNGGLTDSELAAKRQAEADAATAARYSNENAWLISTLESAGGDFARSVAADLQRRPLATFSDRCLDICREIYAKRVGGRRGSKAYDAACDDFDQRVRREG